MIQFLVDKIHDIRFITMLLAARAAAHRIHAHHAVLAGEGLAKRMKRSRANASGSGNGARSPQQDRKGVAASDANNSSPRSWKTSILESGWPGGRAEKLSWPLSRAGAPNVTFLFFRMVTPIVMFWRRCCMCS